eukprot:2211622-Rhodomonas_salina.2
MRNRGRLSERSGEGRLMDPTTRLCGISNCRNSYLDFTGHRVRKSLQKFQSTRMVIQTLRKQQREV